MHNYVSFSHSNRTKFVVVDGFYLFLFYQLSISWWNIGSHEYSTMNLYTVFLPVLLVRPLTWVTFIQWEATDVQGSLWLVTKKTVFTVLLFPSQKTLFKADGASSLIWTNPNLTIWALHPGACTLVYVWTRCIYLDPRSVWLQLCLCVLIICATVCVCTRMIRCSSHSYN